MSPWMRYLWLLSGMEKCGTEMVMDRSRERKLRIWPGNLLVLFEVSYSLSSNHFISKIRIRQKVN